MRRIGEGSNRLFNIKENRQRDRWWSSGGVSASLCSRIDRSATNLGCNFATVVLVSLEAGLVNQTTSTRALHALSIEKSGQTLYSPRNLLCSYLPDKRVVCVWACGEVTIPCHDSLLAVRSPNSRLGITKQYHYKWYCQVLSHGGLGVSSLSFLHEFSKTKWLLPDLVCRKAT